MTRSVQLIRLLTSVLIAFSACYFVDIYNSTATTRITCDHPNAELLRTQSGELILYPGTAAGNLVTEHHTYAYAIPLTGLLLGILIIWRWPQYAALTEAVVSSMWILGLVWVGLVILIWQIQNIPIFSGGRLHY